MSTRVQQGAQRSLIKITLRRVSCHHLHWMSASVHRAILRFGMMEGLLSVVSLSLFSPFGGEIRQWKLRDRHLISPSCMGIAKYKNMEYLVTLYTFIWYFTAGQDFSENLITLFLSFPPEVLSFFYLLRKSLETRSLRNLTPGSMWRTKMYVYVSKCVCVCVNVCICMYEYVN